jgi:hypothetical protein
MHCIHNRHVMNTVYKTISDSTKVALWTQIILTSNICKRMLRWHWVWTRPIKTRLPAAFWQSVTHTNLYYLYRQELFPDRPLISAVRRIQERLKTKYDAWKVKVTEQPCMLLTCCCMTVGQPENFLRYGEVPLNRMKQLKCISNSIKKLNNGFEYFLKTGKTFRPSKVWTSTTSWETAVS